MHTSTGFKLALCLAVGIAAPAAVAIECVAPPPTYLRDFKGELDLAVARVRGIQGPKASAEVQLQSKQLLERIPNADKVLLQLSFNHMLCTALRDDSRLSGAEKARLFALYTRDQRSQEPEAKPAAAGTAPRPAAPRPAPVASRSAAGKASAAGAGTVIHNDSGIVINNSQVNGNVTNTPPPR